MDNIEDILRALADDEGDREEKSPKTEGSDSSDNSEGLFSGLDPEMLLKMLGLFESLNQPDDNQRFLLALKPLLREENRPKVDSALRLLKLFSILPMLKDSGLFGK